MLEAISDVTRQNVGIPASAVSSDWGLCGRMTGTGPSTAPPFAPSEAPAALTRNAAPIPEPRDGAHGGARPPRG